ncbi:MAG: protein kinase [Planctomycetes bacterium]|nr:protein kinase [Planctomycetota bacterium]
MTTPTEQASDNMLDSRPAAHPGNQREPIPGYVLQEQIGIGGYGEVWKAEAPGGLLKAVKFVHGTLDEAGASRELAAMEQIKEVHHPLLLSLERIEIVGGRLVIVSELASASLKDRFDACRESGLDGIPRDELLRHLSDAADALDYLYEEHSLQHLDVKPENLLLVGNRIKVADFGLVRNLSEVNDSAGSGLTPMYAAPEVLRGEPSRSSDQYSLAIVYQQMLTGEPPFAGRTSAQLAAQHHHCKPVLTPLPQPDQAVVSRALSKDPPKRFPGCRVLVDNLQRAGAHGSGGRRTRASRRNTSNPRASADAGCGDAHNDWAVAKTTPFSLENSAIENLPAIDLSERTAEYRPAVFIGLGHTGTQTLARLHQRLAENFGELDRVPCLQMLLIDTDVQSLGQATEAKDAAAVRGRDTMVIPLRRPNEYRAKSEQLLQWLGRRWLYNIPRSLSTEGFRPLGRLALVDHCDKLIERLRATIAKATDAESLAASTKNSGIPFQNKPPRVFIVASTAGGTGSGAVLDLAYVVRELLVEQGVSDDAVYGILAHSTTRKAGERDLALANTYALLMELKHLTHVGGHYAGDDAFHLVSSYQRDATFQHTYLVHLGDELNDVQYESAVGVLADYLYLNSVTPACAFFDSSREDSAKDDPPASATMRTFAVGRARQRDDGPPDAELAALCRSVLDRWLGGRADDCDSEEADTDELDAASDSPCDKEESLDPNIPGIVAQQASSLNLKLATLVEHAIEIVQSEFGCDVDVYLGQVITGIGPNGQRAGHNASTQDVAQEPFGVIDRLMERPNIGHLRIPKADGLCGILTRQLAKLLAAKTTAVREWLAGLLDLPDMRVDGAWRAAICFATQVGKLESTASQVVQRLSDEIAELTNSTPECQADKQLLHYGRLRAYEMAHRCVRDGVRAMRMELAAIADDLRKLRDGLSQVAAKFDSCRAGKADEPEQDIGGQSPGDAGTPGPSPRFVDLMDRQMRNRFAGADGSLQSLFTGKMRDPQLLYKSFRETGRVVLRGRSQKPGVHSPDHQSPGGEPKSSAVKTLIAESTPKLMECGGGKRMLLVAGDQSDVDRMKRKIERAAGDRITALVGPVSDALVCCEMEGVPLDNIAASLIGGRREYAELASRLHTRTDVPWPDA